MATMDQLETALRNADKAGDTKAAQRIAQEITRLRQPQAERQSGLIRGMRDPIDAGAQLLTRVLPEGVVQAGNRFNDWLVDQGVPLTRLGEGGVDEMIRRGEAEYQAGREAAGEEGMDWSRLAGNILSPTNVAIASRIPAGVTAAGRIASGAGAGATFGALQPVTEGDDFWTEKAKQTALGAAAGAVLPAVTGAAARVVRPKSSPQVQALMREGVTPTPGQALGGTAKAVEERLSSLPIVGDTIRASQRRGIAQFNQAVIRRALKPLGVSIPKNVKPGREAFSYADDVIRKYYDDLLPQLRGEMDVGLRANLQRIRQMGQNLPPERAQQLERIIENEVVSRFTKHGKASGETIKNIESKLGQLARGYLRSQDYDQRTMGGAIREVQESIRRMLERVNPSKKGELSKINRAYAEFKRVERAMTSSGLTEDGLFTPAQYNAAVRALDSSKGRSQFARGRALGQDIAAAGKDVLSPKYPDSGTAGRVLTNALAVGGTAVVKPELLIGAAVGSAPYAPGVQNALVRLLATRPRLATPLADMVRASTPYLAPGAAAAANQ